MHKAARSLIALTLAVLGVGLATLVGVAAAKTFALSVAKNATVRNTMGVTTTEAIAVTSKGRAVYTLSGDSKSHPECTAANHCFTFWPPVTVASAKHLSKASGIQGRLGVWHRDGFNQLTLNGHPLYRYVGDGAQKDFASGQDIDSFGGIWHVVPGGMSASTPSSSTTSTMPATPMPTTPTTPNYP